MAEVLRLRATYDSARLRFPIEITVVGSSGLGWFSSTIPSETLVRKVQGVARGFPPFKFRFSSVERFSDSNVYYLAPSDNEPFHDFQSGIAACGLSFEATSYSYTPHCTIAALSNDVSDNAHEELMACPVPDHEIQIASVSFYTVESESQRCYQHERVTLGV
jgi:2'-5' RNA ligase